MPQTPDSDRFSNFCVELDSPWSFKQTNDQVWLPATVPGCVHLDLMSNGVISDPFYRTNERDAQWIETRNWEYRTTFQCPEAWLGYDNVELEFAGLDTFADVYLNGELLLHADNMFVRWQIPVRESLQPGTNELFLAFQSPINRALPLHEKSPYRYPAVNDQAEIPLSVYARKAPYHYGWDWGPRLVTCGIWRPVRLWGWNEAHINDLHFRQLSLTPDAAELELNLDVASGYEGDAEVRLKIADSASSIAVTFPVTLREGAQTVAVSFTIPQPKLWWPNGLGEAHLYRAEAALLTPRGGDRAARNIGLRTVEVVNEKDALGQSFLLKVNGRPVFMKGANYIPPDSFNARVTREGYEKLFEAASAAHFNMLRVWGGGVYEDDYFYELADARGILIWQDFMFACALYPADDEFLKNVEREAVYNVKRLRSHPSLALWCGNNEIAVAWQEWGWQQHYGYGEDDKKALEQGYAKLFHELLPAVVRRHDPARFYFPSSPISGWGRAEEFAVGDNHFWGVWHGEWPIEDYQTYIPRFMSEYGFQSFPDIVTTQRFADLTDFDLFSEVMQHHQRSGKGNGLLQKYLEEWFHQPLDFAALLYVGQLLQAEAVKIAVEAHRRAMPFCMGSLYWQFNDCWPGASWSSIDYYGRWKASHYAVARAYAPVLVAPVLEGGRLAVFLVSDEKHGRQATLNLTLQKFTGEVRWRETRPANVAANAVGLHFDEMLAAFDGWQENDTLFHAELTADGETLSENTLYFAKPRALELPAPNLQRAVKETADGAQIVVRTDVLAKNVFLYLPGDDDAHFSDNYFDLPPGREKSVTLRSRFSVEEIAGKLRLFTLRDSYL